MQLQPEAQDPQGRKLEPLGNPWPLSKSHFSTESSQSQSPYRASFTLTVVLQYGRAKWEKDWEPADLGSSLGSALTCCVSPGKFLFLSGHQGPHQCTKEAESVISALSPKI